MKIKVKIIPEDGPVEVYEFGSYKDLLFFANEREVNPKAKVSTFEGEGRVNTESTNSHTETVDSGFSITQDSEVKVNIDGSVRELSPAETEKPGFIKRLFGVR